MCVVVAVVKEKIVVRHSPETSYLVRRVDKIVRSSPKRILHTKFTVHVRTTKAVVVGVTSRIIAWRGLGLENFPAHVGQQFKDAQDNFLRRFTDNAKPALENKIDDLYQRFPAIAVSRNAAECSRKELCYAAHVSDNVCQNTLDVAVRKGLTCWGCRSTGGPNVVNQSHK